MGFAALIPSYELIYELIARLPIAV